MGHYDEFYDKDELAAAERRREYYKEKAEESYREFLRNMKRYQEGKK